MIDPAHAIDITLPPSQRVPNGVQVNPPPQGITLYFSHYASIIPPWGNDVVSRDEKLRDFWPTESFLSGAICSQVGRYSSFPYTLDGPERMTHIYESVFENCENGQGFTAMMTKVCFDMFTQDNAGFIELIRTSDSPAAPVISMRHKDAARCYRTGNWDVPVIYTDLQGRAHLLKWYQIIPIAEMPAPQEHLRGIQYSVVTRILSAAQVMQAIQQFMHEQVGGLRHHKLHLVGGFNQEIIDTTMKEKIANAESQGRQVYVDPMLLAALSPEGRVTHEEIELSSLPPDFDVDKFMKWYIANISLSWEDEYSSFAPLPGGNLGTAQQSETMADKARSRGPARFMRILEHIFNFYGVLPKNVKMKYGEQDPIADKEKTMLFWRISQILKQLVETGVITPQVAQLMLRDAGYLKKEYLELLGQTDPTPQSVNSDNPMTSAGNA